MSKKEFIEVIKTAIICGFILAFIHVIFNRLGLPWYY